MDENCSHYFLSETAKEIWQKKDGEGQNRMFACLYANHKELYFRRVIFKNSIIPEYRFREFAENAFLQAWESFMENGRAGKIALSAREYTGFFFIIFKRTYLKMIGKELLRVRAEKTFGTGQYDSGETNSEIKKNNFFSRKTQMVLDRMSHNCRQLLMWRHVEGLSHDEIARRKNINRSSSIKTVSRCGKRFFDIWKNQLN